jgi:hypothetical protein
MSFWKLKQKSLLKMKMSYRKVRKTSSNRNSWKSSCSGNRYLPGKPAVQVLLSKQLRF